MIVFRGSSIGSQRRSVKALVAGSNPALGAKGLNR